MMNSKQILLCSLLILEFTAPSLAQLNATDWFDVGLTLYDQDRFNDSIQAYNRAIEINPQFAEAWNNKGINLGLLGRYNEALQAFGNATTINSTYAEAWYNMGVIFDLKRDCNSAIQAYSRAIEINQSYKKAIINKNNDIDIIANTWPNWESY
jgi:tetratricopeptide (TPR) repeat protein